MTILDGLSADGLYTGRGDGPDGPVLLRYHRGTLSDVTCREVPTMRDLLEREDAAEWLAAAEGREIDVPDSLLAPCDLQAVKACGVTFARSMLERVIEERAAGDPAKAEAIRARVGDLVGGRLRDLVPGSEAAAEVKAALQAEGLWSQYLEVGIGPDAEVFSKCPPMAAVGTGADIGLHPISTWNNPEPEIVLAVASDGTIKGAALGNDVNLRDVEGRSALLLGKAKDNNASAAIGPMIRLFDDGYTLDDVRRAEVRLRVEGPEGYVLEGRSSMSEISRDPADLVAQALGPHHQYPDGMMLYCGTLFAPVEDRDVPGQGFTHKIGDMVTIEAEGLGRLVNRVRLSTECAPWTFGAAALMRNLAGRGLL
ncbi:hypothetical protein OG2516_17271 [Oceanicola granulosus HTCC2516]|uniref:Fumarylacetoacetase-like C-terminal domain-containing protein n=1 Tax=Oceanicola granulosus (strain ATCC BAA-861 / DSM 15982 / KCTC 12143 / HTCC2516) TaxID=314256 RepID=Q2CFI9_OCEGH|nr:fumarylacetoacetate hydrolase family protein [Oceanicola granulosus]EAR51493.1 hypothetical protein OG2516_17271 [Oceanicola granulosus HTCC2516]